jgi:hybrid cluster-associated redox disulfide protein
MAQVTPAAHWTVAEVVARCPGAAQAFTRLRMACVGCAMAPFETVAEAAAAYRLEPEAILGQLRAVRPRQAASKAKRQDGEE